MHRLSMTERLVGMGAIVGIATCFTGWGTATTSGEIVKLTAFRVSVLGDLYFLGLAAVLIALVAQASRAELPGSVRRWVSVGAHLALACALLEVPVNAAHSLVMGKGMVLALLTSVALVVLVHRPLDRPRGARVGAR